MRQTTQDERSLPRDAASWARPVETLKVETTGMAASNVDGRRIVGPLQGFGKMWKKTYKVRLSPEVAPSAVVQTWREGFPEFVPFGGGFRVPEGGLVPGAIMLLGGMTGVMVLYSDESSFTYMTPEGHLFSGWITFSAHEDENATVAQVELLIRANDPLYELMMPLGLSAGEDLTWRQTLRSLATHFGSKEKVQTQITCIDPKRQWRQYKNIRHNALLSAALRPLTSLLLRIRPTTRS